MSAGYRVQRVRSRAELGRFCAADGLPELASDALGWQRADAHLMVATGAGRVVARGSVWWRQAPALPGHRVGLIGHYAAAEPEAAARLLGVACEELAAQGCTLAVGPMDGSTWQRYRLLVARGREPVFFLEPDNPDAWPAHFTDNGFTELARYVSILNPELGQPHPRAAEVTERLSAGGVRLRTLRPEAFDDELPAVYAVVAAAFRETFLYAPIGEREFVARYAALRPFLEPELVLIAEHRCRPVGILFALPDWLEAGRRGMADTVILRTLAVRPEHAGTGLGTALLDRFHATARKLGYRRAIYALIHETNRSLRMGARFGREMRRYAVFGRLLRSAP